MNDDDTCPICRDPDEVCLQHDDDTPIGHPSAGLSNHTGGAIIPDDSIRTDRPERPADTDAEDRREERHKIEYALKASKRATLRTGDGTDIELDLDADHPDDITTKVWGINDGGGEARVRIRLVCDARVIGASDGDGGHDMTATVGIDTGPAEDALDELEDRITDIAAQFEDLQRRMVGGRDA